MALGQGIIVSSQPLGHQFEGIVSGTPKPGMVMEIVPATEKVSGRFTWRARSAAVGSKPLPLVVLLEDHNQGIIVTSAYVAGTHCRLYSALPGDELNMLMNEIGGTSVSVAIGDLFGVNSDGTIVTDAGTQSYSSTPFMALETIGALDPYPSTQLVYVMVT